MVLIRNVNNLCSITYRFIPHCILIYLLLLFTGFYCKLLFMRHFFKISNKNWTFALNLSIFKRMVGEIAVFTVTLGKFNVED